MRRRTFLTLAGVIARPGGLELRVERRPAGGWKLNRRYDARQIALLEKLNRADAVHLERLERLAIPGRWELPENEYAPLPVEFATAESKLLIVHVPVQALGAYQAGELVRWGPVCSGAAAHPTAEGWYHLNWKSKGRYSTVNPEWYMPYYFNFDNCNGLGLHSYAMPGRPSSHSCIRMLDRDARWLQDWGETWRLSSDGRTILQGGTPLWIIGRYRFDLDPPWLMEGPIEKVELPAAVSRALPRRWLAETSGTRC